MKNRELFVSDLDGTLLDNNGELSRQSVELLNECISSGALFTIATARTPATVVPMFRDVSMKLPGIVMTGAAWWHFDTQTFSHLHFLNKHEASFVYETFHKNGVLPFVYTIPQTTEKHILEVYYNNPRPCVADINFIEQRRNLSLKHLNLNTPLPDDLLDSVLLFFASGEKSHLESIKDEILSKTACSVTCYEDVYNPGTGLIEIFAGGVSKASAIKDMCKELNIEKITVFGDNLNDLPMFAVADTSVAVANAMTEVTEKATLSIGTNLENSVPKYILKALR